MRQVHILLTFPSLVQFPTAQCHFLCRDHETGISINALVLEVMAILALPASIFHEEVKSRLNHNADNYTHESNQSLSHPSTYLKARAHYHKMGKDRPSGGIGD